MSLLHSSLRCVFFTDMWGRGGPGAPGAALRACAQQRGPEVPRRRLVPGDRYVESQPLFMKPGVTNLLISRGIEKKLV